LARKGAITVTIRTVALAATALCVLWQADVHAGGGSWPGAAPCNTTLQACLNASGDNDIVNIVTDGPINEDIVLAASRGLSAGTGFRPAFAPGRSLTANSAGAGDFEVLFRGLTLNDGHVQLGRSGTGNAVFRVEDMTLNSTVNTANTRIRIDASANGTVAVAITGNTIQAGSSTVDAPAIDIRARGSVVSGAVAFNRIESPRNSLANGIRSFSEIGGELDLSVFANEVRGFYQPGAMMFSTLTAPTTLRLINNLVVGNRSLGTSGSVDGIRLVAGSVELDAQVLNNTITDTGAALRIGAAIGGTAEVDGSVQNNLIVFNAFGLMLSDGAAGVTNSRNLVFGNPTNSFLPGTGTLLVDPHLVALRTPRLRADSPAIDAGNAVTTQVYIAVAQQPQVDLDGMRRTVGTGAQAIDIGAYEYGDVHLLARKHAAGSSNNFLIDHPALNDQTLVRPQLTGAFTAPNYPSVANPHATGLWYTGGRWSPFNQDLAAMPQGTMFNVFVPGPQGAFGSVYAHTATLDNTSADRTLLSATYLNGTTDAFILVTANWNQPGTSVYNDHNLSVFRQCTGDTTGPGCWAIVTQDGAAMPVGATFNVYAQDLSPNAWRHFTGGSNIDGQTSWLDHPLLNGTPCARPQVAKRWQFNNDIAFDLRYDAGVSGGRWGIRRLRTADPMPTGLGFSVLVSPAQVFECRDTLFVNGYQG
jgi:hypothetical protein